MSQKSKQPAVGQRCNFYRKLNGSFIPDGLAQYEGLTIGDKWLWGRFYRYSGKNGQCFPTVKTLADDMGCTERTIHRRIARLMEKRFIEIEKMSGYQNRNRYYLLYHECFDNDWKVQGEDRERVGSESKADAPVKTVSTSTDMRVRVNRAGGDNSVVIDCDTGVRKKLTPVSYKEDHSRDSNKENHHHSSAPSKFDFQGLVKGMDYRGGGDLFNLSEEDKEYADLVMEYKSENIENKARYRRTLENLALRGELDKSDLEDLRERKKASSNVAKIVKMSSVDDSEKKEKVVAFRRSTDCINCSEMVIT